MAGLDNSKFTPDRIGGAISKAKNQLIGPERYASEAGDFFTQTVARAYHYYQKKLRDASAMDFDDLLYLPALALKHNEELRAELDARFRFILIDEYQDTNKAQYQLARRLSVDHPNLCVVGDPDQSIYGWRGSDIKNILDFERDFPATRVVMLGKNFRSTPAILNAAGRLIEHNKRRKKKPLETDNPRGQPVRVLTFDSGLDEADQVVAQIKEAVAQKRYAYKDVAVFVRMNALTRSLESAFIKHAVPFQIVKGVAYFERKENKDILAYLRLLLNPNDDLSFQRVVNEPARGVGKVSLEHLQDFAASREMPLMSACAQAAAIPAIKGKAAGGLKQFQQLMSELRGFLDLPADQVISQVINRSGYRDMLNSSGDPEDADRLANIEELVTAARQFVGEDPSRTISDFLEHITLSSDVDGWNDSQNCVSVMTLHSSKGLEFPIVFILAVEEGILPHERSLRESDDGEKEEERRLLFVGMTRAMKELSLCHSRLREFRGQAIYAIPSGFLNELPQEEVEHQEMSRHAGRVPAHDYYRGGSAVVESAWKETGVPARGPVIAVGATVHAEYSVGQVVQHESYGIGLIADVSGFGALRKIKIRFSAHGLKTFIADKVKLKVVPKKG